MKLLPDLGLEETTSKEFTGWEGRGAMGLEKVDKVETAENSSISGCQRWR